MRFIFAIAGILYFIPAISQKKVSITFKIHSPNSLNSWIISYKGLEGFRADTIHLHTLRTTYNTWINGPERAELTPLTQQKKTQRNYQEESRIFYLEPGKMKIDLSDSISKIKISGKGLNKAYNALRISEAPIENEILYLKNLKPSSAYTLLNINKRIALLLDKKDQEILLPFIKENRNSLAGFHAFVAYTERHLFSGDLKALFNGFSKSIKETEEGEELKNRIEITEITSIGKRAPDFNLPDTSGKMIRLSDFQGQYVLIDFWASWCVPCRIENPNLVAAFKKYNSRQFTILGISLDREVQKEYWLRAIQNDQLYWTQLCDFKGWDNEVVKKYGIKSIPQNVLVDKDGVIVARNITGASLHDFLDTLFL